jgi:hypothetical protein
MKETNKPLTIKETRELKRQAAAILPALVLVRDLLSEIDDPIEFKFLSGFLKTRNKKLNAIHKRIDAVA